MSATNQNALSISTGKVYIANWANITSLLDNLSNAVQVITDLDALSYTQIASVTDVTFAVWTGEKKVIVETDDNGIIWTGYIPSATINGNRFESNEVWVIEKMLWLTSLSVAWGTPYKVMGQNITPKTLPKMVVKIVGTADANNKKRTIYLYDSMMSADILTSFLDVVRAGNLKGTAFTFEWNKNGIRLHKTELY